MLVGFELHFVHYVAKRNVNAMFWYKVSVYEVLCNCNCLHSIQNASTFLGTVRISYSRDQGHCLVLLVYVFWCSGQRA
jgi:hypothetical protein